MVVLHLVSVDMLALVDLEILKMVDMEGPQVLLVGLAELLTQLNMLQLVEVLGVELPLETSHRVGVQVDQQHTLVLVVAQVVQQVSLQPLGVLEVLEEPELLLDILVAVEVEVVLVVTLEDLPLLMVVAAEAEVPD